MKILHISSVQIDYPGGTEKVIWELAKRQAKNHEVTILQTNLYQEKLKVVKEEVREGVKIITCQNDFFLGGFGYSKIFVKTLKKMWKDFDVAHIHGHGRFTSNFSMKFLNKKIPFIYSGQGFFHTKKHSFFKKVYDFFFASRLKNARFCTALTDLEKTKLLGFGIEKEKIKVIPGGIDFQKFHLKENKKKLKKYLFKKEFNKKVLLYVGRIHESKGLQTVIEAIKDMDLIFVIAGKDAGYKKILESKIKTLGIQNKIRFLGNISEEKLIKTYNAADLFVLFSDWEGFGLVVIEAMASGVPVIGSNNGALPLLIKNNYNGFIAENNEELKEKIKLTIKDKKLMKKLRKNSIKFAETFDWKNIVEMHVKLYMGALKEYGR